jgi:NADPH:quinone reductase-like Zn-dependent oxidoreductase
MRVRTVSVNVTLDIAVRKGVYARKPSLPHILGVDPSGDVVAVGLGVDQPKVGDRVFVHTARPNPVAGKEGHDAAPRGVVGVNRWGGYAEYVTVPAENTYVFPERLDYAHATALMRHLPTARHLVHTKAQLKPGEWILVMGASGGLASCCIQVAKLMGAKVIGAAGSDERVRIGREYGADHGINYRTQDLAAEVMKITGEGVHVVAENVGDPTLWPGAFNSLRTHGRLVTAGAHGGGEVKLDLRRLYLKRITVMGDPSCDIADIEWSLEAAKDGTMKPPLIDRVLPLGDAAEGHRLIETRAATGKVLLDPTR